MIGAPAMGARPPAVVGADTNVSRH